MDPAARVRDGIERVPFEAYDERTGRFAVGAALAVWLLGLMVLAAVLAWLLPDQTARVAQAARERFGWSVLIGFLALVAMPPAIVILLVTVIGIPLALVALLLYFGLLFLGYAAAGIALGNAVLTRWQAGWRRALAAALGVLALSLLALVPWLGALVAFLALITGMGAILVSMKTKTEVRA